MARSMFRIGTPALALASLLLVAGPSRAQYQSFPGDWAQPGRDSGFGYSGLQPRTNALPFPYDGLSGTYTPRDEPTTPVVRRTYDSFQPTVVNTRAYVRVHVPAAARVFFDDHPTTQTGSERLFITPALQKGLTYQYRVSARWLQDGKERTASREVRLVSGQTVRLEEFVQPAPAKK